MFPRAPQLDTTPRRTGITVVTRDYSLFENPITVDYFDSE
jgi:hypothetical protein